MSAQKKNNLMELRNRQLKLKLELKDQEAVLNSKLKMLEDNFGLMTINSVLPIPAGLSGAVTTANTVYFSSIILLNTPTANPGVPKKTIFI